MFPQKVAQFFSLRGIDYETLKRFGVYWNGSEIVIPIKNEKGETLFKKYRRSPESEEGPKYRNEHGSSVTLFNYNPDAKKVIITEGELDCIRLATLGYDAVTTTGGSQSFPKEFIEKLQSTEEVYIAYDSDLPGIKGAVKLAGMFPKESNVKLVPFPEYWNGKDVTDYLQHHTKEEFEALIKNAIKLPDNEKIKKSIDECVMLRRKLKSLKLSTDIIEEYLLVLNLVKNKTDRIKKKKEYDDDFTNVKQVPIDRFVDFNGAGFASCIWHSPDKSPSLKYYPKNNTCYCFSCAHSGDVISVVMQINNCTFPQALEILKKYL